jgi:polyhydroxybutyrate depolymerase
VVGDYSANKLDIDDVGFLTGLADKLAGEIGADPSRVFAVGASRGGQMAYRLALEAPSRFRAVAVVSANVPMPENFKCRPAGQGTSSILITNGTEDPINPFHGGEVKLFGMLRRGKVRSSRDSAQYFADLNHLTGTPATHDTPATGGDHVEQVLWRNASGVEVELIAIHSGGHGLPQPYSRFPRLLGPTPKVNGPALIWAFFERQRPRSGAPVEDAGRPARHAATIGPAQVRLTALRPPGSRARPAPAAGASRARGGPAA